MSRIIKTEPKALLSFDMVVCSVPFTAKSILNEFGDFDRLQVRAYRERSTEAVQFRWFFSAEGHGILKELNEIETHQALLDYFYQTSSKTEPKAVASMTDGESRAITPVCSGLDRKNPLWKLLRTFGRKPR